MLRLPLRAAARPSCGALAASSAASAPKCDDTQLPPPPLREPPTRNPRTATTARILTTPPPQAPPLDPTATPLQAFHPPMHLATQTGHALPPPQQAGPNAALLPQLAPTAALLPQLAPRANPASPSRTIGANTTDPHTPPSAEPQGPETPLPSSSDSDSGSDALAPGPDRPRSRPRRNPPARPTLATAEPDTMLIHPMPLLSLLSLPDRQHDATQAPLSGHQIRSFPLQAPLPDPKSSDIYGWLD